MAAVTPSATMQLTAAEQARINLAWEMGVASLIANNNQLLLTKAVCDSIGVLGVEVLKTRLSNELGGIKTVAHVDDDFKTMRIRADPTEAGVGSPSSQSTTSTEPESSLSPASPHDKVSLSAQRSYGKKSKTPRPPNAFILYRQHHHPVLKVNFPEMHNNQISVILGKQWKNETQEVKDKYHKLSKDMKERHAAQYPDYQYAPRKPGEKKRRMTARKMQKLRERQGSPETSAFTPNSSYGIADLDFPLPPVVSCSYGRTPVGDYISMGDVDNYSQDYRPMTITDSANMEPLAGTAQITFPTPATNIQADFEAQFGRANAHASPINSNTPPDDFENATAAASAYQEVDTANPPELDADEVMLSALIDWNGTAMQAGGSELSTTTGPSAAGAATEADLAAIEELFPEQGLGDISNLISAVNGVLSNDAAI